MHWMDHLLFHIKTNHALESISICIGRSINSIIVHIKFVKRWTFVGIYQIQKDKYYWLNSVEHVGFGFLLLIFDVFVFRFPIFNSWFKLFSLENHLNHLNLERVFHNSPEWKRLQHTCTHVKRFRFRWSISFSFETALMASSSTMMIQIQHF